MRVRGDSSVLIALWKEQHVFCPTLNGLDHLKLPAARARSGVTANVVCPGPTDTPFLRETAAKHEDAQAVLTSMTRGVPMKRLAQPEEIATAVRFFADASAGYITGQTLSVSGGLTMA